MALKFGIQSPIDFSSLIRGVFTKKKKPFIGPTRPVISDAEKVSQTALTPGQFGAPSATSPVATAGTSVLGPQRPAPTLAPKTTIKSALAATARPAPSVARPVAPVSPVATEITKRAEEVESPKTKVLARITAAGGTQEAFKPADRLAELEKERGVIKRREEIGTFEQEIAKTNELLDFLEEDISKRTRPFGVSEAERRRILGAERAPILKQLGIQERGLSAITGIQRREKESIVNTLAAEAEQAGIPFETLKQEISLKKGINELFEDSERGEVQRATADLMGQGIEDKAEIVSNIISQFPNADIDDITDTIEAIAPEEEKPFTLGPGQIRFGPEGEILARGIDPVQLTKEAIEKTEKNQASRQAQSQSVSLISGILADEGMLRQISGVTSRIPIFGTAGTSIVRNKMIQLKAMTALDGREKLKGSGTISDFEAKMLADSASTINAAIQENGTVRFPEDELIQELKNLRGIMATKAGVLQTVSVTDPSTGESRGFEDATQEEINNWALEGLIIDYQ